MCFSAEASFTASFVLSAIGYATLKVNHSKSQLFLAAIPCLFAAQQFSEGLVWLGLSHPMFAPAFLKSFEKLFLIFAFVIWPIWIPLSLLQLETVGWRRNLLMATLACGIMLTALNLAYGFKYGTNVQIVHHSLQYIGQAPPQSLLYPLTVLIPSFLSSYKYIWMLGVLGLTAYFITDYYYSLTFISVWCFFASLISLLLYQIIKYNQKANQNLEHTS